VKKLRPLLIATAILSLLAAACGSGKTTTTAPTTAAGPKQQITVKIAHVAALTGAISAANQAQVRGMDLALEKANASGKYKIEIKRDDSGADPTKAVAITKENAADSSIVLQIGPAASGEFFAAVPLAESLKLPIYSVIAGGTYPGEYSDWTWNSGLPEDAAIPGLIKFAKDKSAKTIGVLFPSDQDFGKTAAASFTKAAKDAGFNIVSESFGSKDVSFAAQVSKLKGSNPDLVYIATVPQQAGFLIKGIRDGGITVPTMSTDNSVGNHKLVVDNSQGAAEGHVIVSAYDPFSTRPVVKDYATAFNAKFPGVAIAQDPYSYDGIMIVKAALESIQAPVTREKVKEALGKVSIEGVTGSKISWPTGHGVAQREGFATIKLTKSGDIAPL
jgi:branched-chain amino acid transport system substrate-binding protein